MSYYNNDLKIGSDSKMQKIIILVIISLILTIISFKYNISNTKYIGISSMIFFIFLSFIYFLSDIIKT